MAIVFISPKSQTRVFFWGISICLVLFLAMVSYITFFPVIINKNQGSAGQVSSDNSGISIDSSIFNSQEVKNLVPAPIMPTTFNYVAKDKNGKQVAGSISADNQSDAQETLQIGGLTVVSIQASPVGNSNPFGSN